MEFGQWLRQHREARKMTQKDVADRAGVSFSYVSTLERRQPHSATGRDVRPVVEKVTALAKAVGGKESAKHANKRLMLGRGSVGKQAVLGMRERGGRTKAMPIAATDLPTIQQAIHDNIAVGSVLCTDEHGAYSGIGGLFFTHDTVNHSAGEYRRGMAHTNSIESVWALLKRGIRGVYHHTSKKHLGRYVNEFTFRLNYGNVKFHTLQRLDSFVIASVGRRITWKELTA